MGLESQIGLVGTDKVIINTAFVQVHWQAFVEVLQFKISRKGALLLLYFDQRNQKILFIRNFVGEWG